MRKFFSVLFALIATCDFLVAQINLHEGFEFSNSAVVFREIGQEKLLIYSSYDACLSIKVPFRQKDTAFAITKDSFYKFDIDSLVNFFYPDSIQNDSINSKWFFVTSTMPVVLIMESNRGNGAGRFRTSILSNTSRPKEYLLHNGRYKNAGMDETRLNIFSTNKNNSILIAPRHSVGFFPITASYEEVASLNNPGTITLDSGFSVMLTYGNGDIKMGSNGTFIQSTFPVVVTIFESGGLDHFVTPMSYACALSQISNNNYQIYQNKPLYMAGDYYPFIPINNNGKDYINLFATKPNTDLFFNNQFIKTLDSLEHWDTCFIDASIVRSNKPIMFGQFVQVGTPQQQPFELFGVAVQNSDTSEFITKAIFDAVVDYNLDTAIFTLNITAYSADTNLLLLNGQPLLNAGWQFYPSDSTLSWCTIQVQSGLHILESSSKFSALYYPQSFLLPYTRIRWSMPTYMLPGLTPTAMAADSVQFYYSVNGGARQPWANGTAIGCSGATLTFYPNIARHTTWLWSFGDGTTFTQRVGSTRASAISHTFTNPGQYWVTVTDSAGCAQPDSVLIVVEPNPIADFDAETQLSCEGYFISLQNQSTGATSYNWQWPGGNSTAENPNFIYTGSSTQIPVTLIASNGNCTDTLIQDIELRTSNLEQIKLPNIITPNSDGVNDALCFEGTEGFAECFNLQIFNRWGGQVYQTRNPQDCWQATGMAGGVYFYVLTLGETRLQGSVTVMK